MATESLTQVEWRDIPGWPGYQVSNDGQVRSGRRFGTSGVTNDPWRILKQDLGTRYPCVSLFRDRKKTSFYVHVLVLTVFVGPRPMGMDVCHNNDIKTDNRLENLRWDTRSENIKDIERNGKVYAIRRANKLGNAKLTMALAKEIRELYLSGQWNYRTLAKMFSVGRSTIAGIVKHRNWKVA